MALPYLYIVIILCKWYNRTYNLSGKEHNDECFGYQKEVKKKKEAVESPHVLDYRKCEICTQDCPVHHGGLTFYTWHL